jgi:hypothetical protein
VIKDCVDNELVFLLLIKCEGDVKLLVFSVGDDARVHGLIRGRGKDNKIILIKDFIELELL